MNIAAALALQSIPFAGLAIAACERREILLVSYVGVLGILLSIVAIIDNYNGFSPVFGLAVDALQ
ncbi:hypothetical protein ACRAWG_31140 [Methylobacterium sp. P31]